LKPEKILGLKPSFEPGKISALKPGSKPRKISGLKLVIFCQFQTCSFKPGKIPG